MKLKLCTQCLNQVKPKGVVRGSIIIELGLWLFFLLPGLIYSLWRVAGGREPTCPECGGHNLVPLDSPAAKTLITGMTRTDEAA